MRQEAFRNLAAVSDVDEGVGDNVLSLLTKPDSVWYMAGKDGDEMDKKKQWVLHHNWFEPGQDKITACDYTPVADLTIHPVRENHESEMHPAELIRVPFVVEKPVSKARVSVTAHGVYELRLNGGKVGEEELAPGVTPYDKLLYVQTFDVSGELVTGENVFGILLADGWWRGRVGLLGADCQYGTRLGYWLECHILYEDGEEAVIGGGSGQSYRRRILYSDLFLGEVFDASKEPFGWDRAGFHCDGGWTQVQAAAYDENNLRPQEGSGIQVVERITPCRILRTPSGALVLDVGKVIAGRMEFRVRTEKGHKIILDHSEILDEKGEYIHSVAGPDKDQRDVYITKDGEQVWHPLFTYHGFRYVKITGWPGEPDTGSFTAQVLSTPIEWTGSFCCSDERLNRLHENIRNSQVSNTVSIPTDCPQREKAGWTGDMMVYAPTMLRMSDGAEFLRRWLGYCRMEQLPDGQIPAVVPYWDCYQKFMDRKGAHSSSGWGDAIVRIPWDIYEATGNEEVLRENYEAMKRWVSYIEKQVGEEQLWSFGFHFGDWLLPSIMKREGAVPMDSARATAFPVATAYYADSARILEETSAALGEKEDCSYYHGLHERIRQAFVKAYLKEDGSSDWDYQGIYVLALAFHLVPKELEEKCAKRLADKIRENGGCLDTGFLSVGKLLEVLTEHGYESLAYEVLFQEKSPGWLYMIKHGATGMWESWHCMDEEGRPGRFSYNHFAFGCVGEFFYRYLAGIRILEPGYRRVAICPGIASPLRYVKASQRTPFGELKVSWEKAEDHVKVALRIPKGVTAVLALRDKEQIEIDASQECMERNYRLKFYN